MAEINISSGIESFTAGENISEGDVIALDSSSEARLADATFSSDLYRVCGVALNTVLVGALVIVQTGTGALVGATFSAAPAAAQNGEYVYLSSTPGRAVLTPPFGAGTVSIAVGILEGADGVDLTPDILLQPRYISRTP